MCVCVYVCVCVYMYVCVCICMCVCVYGVCVCLTCVSVCVYEYLLCPDAARVAAGLERLDPDHHVFPRHRISRARWHWRRYADVLLPAVCCSVLHCVAGHP